MKTKKIIAIGLGVFFFISAIFPFVASAAIVTWTCDVIQARSNSDGSVTIVVERDGIAGTKGFSAAIGQENQVLAVALTAISLGYQVKIRVDWTSAGSDIEYISLSAPAP